MGSDVAMVRQMDARLSNSLSSEIETQQSQQRDWNCATESGEAVPLSYSYVLPTGAQVLSKERVMNPLIVSVIDELLETKETDTTKRQEDKNEGTQDCEEMHLEEGDDGSLSNPSVCSDEETFASNESSHIDLFDLDGDDEDENLSLIHI